MWQRKLRSTIFNVLLYTITPLAAVLVALTVLVPGGRLTRQGILLWINTVFWLLKLIVGLKIDIRGRENLPPQGGYILCAKHQSNIDPLIAFKLTPHMTALAKKELFAVPVLGAILRTIGIIRIDRQAGTAHKNTLDTAIKVFKSHRPLLIYPEGTRVRLHESRPLKKGVYHFQTDVDLPVVTVATNSGLYWMKGSLRKNPGTLIVELSPPMPKGMNKDDFMAEIKSRIITRSDDLMAAARTVDPALPSFTPAPDSIASPLTNDA